MRIPFRKGVPDDADAGAHDSDGEVPPQRGRNAQRAKPMSGAEAGRLMEEAMPDTAFGQAQKMHFEAVGQPAVQSARLFVAFVITAIIAVGELVVISYLLPLKEIQPWVVFVNRDTGEVGLQKDLAQRWANYKPERAVLERELFNVVRNMYALNSDALPLVQESHRKAYAYMRGSAADKFREFIAKEAPYQRMATTPGLTRQTERTTISFRNDAQVVLIRFTTEERTPSQTGGVRRSFLMQFTYVRVAGQNPDELLENPLGIYVTDFEIQEER